MSKKPKHYRTILELPKRLYAIGDIHGCAEELEHLLLFLKNEQKVGEEDQIIFIGDYIDRGPDSKKVVDEMLRMKREYPKTVFLMGNHEEMLLGFLGYEGTTGVAYIPNGGGTTLASYGISGDEKPEEIRRKISPTHIEFFRTLDSCVVIENFIFVHAGLHPLKKLDDQDYSDMHWIRNEFIYNVHNFEKTIIFGHTPFLDVLFHLPFKMGIDTGLVYGNKLSCVELTQRQIFQIKRGETAIVVRSFDEAIKQQNES